MAYDDTQKVRPKTGTLKLDGREKLALTGVSDVSGFDENTVLLSTELGELTVRGSGLHIERIELDKGELELRGQVQELRYDDSPAASTLWGRLFG